MIKIEAKPFEVQAELPGYGIFRLRRLGAGVEADIRNMLEDANADIKENADRYKDIIDKETQLIQDDKQKELEELRSSQRYIDAERAQKKASEKLQKAVDYSKKCQMELWRSDDPEALRKLFADFSFEQIMGFYNQVMREADNG